MSLPDRSDARSPLWFAEFGDRTVELVCAALAAEWGVFFLLDETVTGYGYCSRGVPVDLPLSYVAQDVQEHDPLHPRRLSTDHRRFTTIFDPALVASPERRRDQQWFWKFLQSFGARDAAEMIFWNGRRPVGGMSLIWRDKTSRCRDPELALTLQSYIEFNLIGALADRSTPHSNAGNDALTERELQVAEFVALGCTNSEIARALGVTVATVKTHLIHVFGKLQVNNRVALARCMVARSPQGRSLALQTSRSGLDDGLVGSKRSHEPLSS